MVVLFQIRTKNINDYGCIIANQNQEYNKNTYTSSSQNNCHIFYLHTLSCVEYLITVFISLL